MDKTAYDIIPLFLYDLTQNSDKDGYNIVKEYLDSDYMRIKTLHDKIGKSATSDLIKKRQEEDGSYALWEIVEVLSFGHSSLSSKMT